MIYCVALTGSIASGKSTAMAVFQSLGIPVISADKVARDLTHKGSDAFSAIHDRFGDNILNERGSLNRALLRRRITFNPHDRLWLEQLLHPPIKAILEETVLNLRNKPYCVVEIPLLTDCQDYPYINRVLVLLSQKENQVERLMVRDHCDYDEASQLLAIQPPDAVRRKMADDLLINDHTIEALKVAVKKLHHQYVRLAEEGL